MMQPNHHAASTLKVFVPEEWTLAGPNLRRLLTHEAIILSLLNSPSPNLDVVKLKLDQAQECVNVLINSNSPMASLWVTKLNGWLDWFSFLKNIREQELLEQAKTEANAAKGKELDLRPLTTINSMPFEMKFGIFKFFDPTEALFLRAVCLSWKESVEKMYVPKEHVLICTKDDHDKEDLSGRFFATNLDKFTKFEMKTKYLPTKDYNEDVDVSVISHSFLRLISGMFPNLVHLLIDTVLDAQSANSLIEFLPTLKKLRVLSIFKTSYLPKNRKLALQEAINNCHKIERLGITDLGRNWYRYMRYARFKHFAYESENDDIIDEVVSRLSINTFSFWTRVYSLDREKVENWVKINPNFVTFVENLSVGSLVDKNNIGRAFVNVSSFFYVQILRIEFASHSLSDLPDSYIFATLDPLTFGTMTGLFNLRRLELVHFELNPKDFNEETLASLEQVIELKLTRFSFKEMPFDGPQLCQIVSRLFPSLEKLTLVVLNLADGEAVQQSYGQYFAYLKEFNFTVFSPPVKESYHEFE